MPVVRGAPLHDVVIAEMGKPAKGLDMKRTMQVMHMDNARNWHNQHQGKSGWITILNQQSAMLRGQATGGYSVSLRVEKAFQEMPQEAEPSKSRFGELHTGVAPRMQRCCCCPRQF